jgi:CBS domain-containing protein
MSATGEGAALPLGRRADAGGRAEQQGRFPDGCLCDCGRAAGAHGQATLNSAREVCWSQLFSQKTMNTPISALLERKGSAVHSVAPTLSVQDAVAEMNRHRIGAIVVLDGPRLVGIFTERDVLRRVVGAGLDPKSALVADVMSPGVITIAPDATVEQTMTIFTERRCRHLPVLQDGAIRGVISIGDITRWMADANRAEAEHLRNYITGGTLA